MFYDCVGWFRGFCIGFIWVKLVRELGGLKGFKLFYFNIK